MQTTHRSLSRSGAHVRPGSGVRDSPEGSPHRVEFEVGTSIKGAAETFKDAKSTTAALKSVLKAQLPWSREVEFHRQRARNFYMTLLFAHPLSTYAQSIDHLWLDTSYTLIQGYRDIVARLEAALPPPAPQQGRGKGKGANSANGQANVELRKALTRFRQALVSEDTFYRNLLTRIVSFYQLQSIASEELTSVHIPVTESVPGGGPDQGLATAMSTEEREKKLGLVYKGLICSGDLERYKEQYGEKARKEAREGWRDNRAGVAEERFKKAKMYYEAARRLLPDNGAAFNQMAVISSYSSDNFLCIYHYFRALAVKQPFPGGEGNLERIFKKIYDKWRAARHAGDEEGRNNIVASAPEDFSAKNDVETFKNEFLVAIAVIFLKAGTSYLLTLKSSTLPQLASLLRTRSLPAEIIVKLTATTIGSHWHARMSTSAVMAISEEGDGPSNLSRRAKRRPDAEELALDYLLCVFSVLLQVGATEIDEALVTKRLTDTGGGESALQVDDGGEDDQDIQLSTHISAVLRRLLPSLRVLSKWLKSHVDYLSRFKGTTTDFLHTSITEFWTIYSSFTIRLSILFPIALLPSLTDPLEEERDMKGFSPLKRGHADVLGQPSANTPQQVHPNEEQLMRISDLLVDAKLLVQAEAGRAAMDDAKPAVVEESAPAESAREAQVHSVESVPNPREIDDGDMASVSTETEDDPVNLAMRATLGEGSSLDGEEERENVEAESEEEEVILWGRGITGTPVNQQVPPRGAPQTTTAFDLLQSLAATGTGKAFESRRMSGQGTANSPGATGGQPAAQVSSALLFGGDYPGGAGSIWTMTREDSGKGSKRLTDPAISSIWDQPAVPSPSRSTAQVPVLPPRTAGQGVLPPYPSSATATTPRASTQNAQYSLGSVGYQSSPKNPPAENGSMRPAHSAFYTSPISSQILQSGISSIRKPEVPNPAHQLDDGAYYAQYNIDRNRYPAYPYDDRQWPVLPAGSYPGHPT